VLVKQYPGYSVSRLQCNVGRIVHLMILLVFVSGGQKFHQDPVFQYILYRLCRRRVDGREIVA